MEKAKVVVTFEETEEGAVNIRADWGEGGPDPESKFHKGVNRMLLVMDALYGTGEGQYIEVLGEGEK